MRMEKSKDKLVEREVFPRIVKWLKEREIMAINGPRQAGKTTLLRQIKELLKKEKVVYVDFEDTQDLENFLRSPKDFVSLQLSQTAKTYFLFDEFQYLPNAGKILKLLYDEFPKAKFIITGSASLKIKEVASFLVGRVVFFTLYPFSFAEFLSYKSELLFNLWKKNRRFFLGFLRDENETRKLPPFIFEGELLKAVDEYLTFGGYPAIVTSSLDFKKDRLSALVETYIEKDIIRYLKIGNFLEFKNLAKITSAQVGNLINYSSLSSDAKLSYQEVKTFLGVLENTFVIKLLSPFSSNKITEIKKSPKVYFLDMGLRNQLIADFRHLELRREMGAMIENFVFQNLFFRQQTANIYFWRTKQEAEVDFVLRVENEIVPLEVKYQKFAKPHLSRSFISFIKSYQPKKGIVLTKGDSGFLRFQNTKILFLPFYFV